MSIKYRIFAILALFLALGTNSVSAAVNTVDIDRVRGKAVLDNEDFQVIDRFVSEAIDELINTRDFTSVAKSRAVILSRKHSSRESAAAQYSLRFSESAYKYISVGLERAEQLTPQEVKFKVMLNLLILTDSLEYLQVAGLARDFLNDENKAIRYWAVHCLTSSAVTEQLNSEADNLKLASDIAEQLGELVEQAEPEVIALIADFAARIKIERGEDLLLQIADMRISRYADWTVDYELLDASVLKLLQSRMFSSGTVKPAVAQRFAQLYSYAIQRYIKGQDFLSDTQKQYLASVLVGTERSCIVRLLGQPQSLIKRAVEQDAFSVLLAEHNRLLGDAKGPGQLALKLNFDYGNNSDGSGRTAPLALPQPPKELIIDER